MVPRGQRSDDVFTLVTRSYLDGKIHKKSRSHFDCNLFDADAMFSSVVPTSASTSTSTSASAFEWIRLAVSYDRGNRMPSGSGSTANTDRGR